MSTNAMIYAKQKDNTIKGIYLHWDGYPSWAGNKLLNHYTNPKKIEKLINLGSISSLGDNIEPPELVKRFGFHATSYPYDKSANTYRWLPKEWRDLSETERTKLHEDYEKFEGTIAYHRDRNEELEQDEYPSEKDLKTATSNAPYEYYHDGTEWFVRSNKRFTKLTQDYCDKHTS